MPLHIDGHPLTKAEFCVINAPKGAFEKISAVLATIHEIEEYALERIRDLGLATEEKLVLRELEQALYTYIRQSNLTEIFFDTAETFGAAMLGTPEEKEEMLTRVKQGLAFAQSMIDKGEALVKELPIVSE